MPKSQLLIFAFCFFLLCFASCSLGAFIEIRNGISNALEAFDVVKTCGTAVQTNKYGCCVCKAGLDIAFQFAPIGGVKLKLAVRAARFALRKLLTGSLKASVKFYTVDAYLAAVDQVVDTTETAITDAICGDLTGFCPTNSTVSKSIAPVISNSQNPGSTSNPPQGSSIPPFNVPSTTPITTDVSVTFSYGTTCSELPYQIVYQNTANTSSRCQPFSCFTTSSGSQQNIVCQQSIPTGPSPGWLNILHYVQLNPPNCIGVPASATSYPIGVCVPAGASSSVFATCSSNQYLVSTYSDPNCKFLSGSLEGSGAFIVDTCKVVGAGPGKSSAQIYFCG